MVGKIKPQFWVGSVKMTEDTVFYECEIVEEDDNAPVGTLVNVFPDSNNSEDDAFFEVVDDETSDETGFVEEPSVSDEQEVSKDESPVVSVEKTTEKEDFKQNSKATISKDEHIIYRDASARATEAFNAVQQNEAVPSQNAQAVKKQSQTAEKMVDRQPVKQKEQSDSKPAKPARKSTLVKNDENDIGENTAHIRSGLKILSKTANVQSILGGTDFSIGEKKPMQKTMTTAKKPQDPWAVANLDGNQPKKVATPSPAPKKPRASKTFIPFDEDELNSENNNSMEENIMAKEKETVKAKTSAKSEPTETVIVEGTQGVPHGKFVIKRTDNDNFVFKLFSSNRRVVAVAAGQYTSLGACKIGIQSVINNAATAPIEDQTLKNVVEQKCPKWIIYNDKRGEVRLRLISANGNMVAATNDGYLSKDAAKKGIEAIARAAQGADIVRNDDLW